MPPGVSINQKATLREALALLSTERTVYSMGGGADAFITKFGSTGSVMFSTYLGGTGIDGATGVAVDAFTTGSGDNVTRNWYGFWMTSAAGAFVIFVLVAAVFKSTRGIRAQQEALATGD